jgi:hypothetical protein
MERLFMRRWLLLVASIATGCVSVPTVTFGPDGAPADSGSDGATESSSALDAADHTAPTSDAPADSGAFDATATDGSSTTCPQGVPDGASICCGPVPCKGPAAACQSQCTNCENNCPAKTCCLDKHGNFTGCAASPSICP